jgi:class III poly(R)-hydroxyalkanoic acid synthase PhaE subunit
MKDSGPLDPNQTQEWIERERERLRGERKQSGQQDQAWISSLREWLKMLRPQASASFAGASEDELSQTLRGLGAAQQGIMELLTKMPPLGITATYFEPWTQLQAAEAEFRKVESQFRETLVDVHLKALDELELRLKSRQGAPPTERELYDLWIDCGEAVFAKTAHSGEFARLQGSMSNAAVHRVNAQKKVLEQTARMFDLPTRSELNSVHQQLRTVRRELESLQAQSVGPQRVQKSKARRSPTPTRKVSKSAGSKARKGSR